VLDFPVKKVAHDFGIASMNQITSMSRPRFLPDKLHLALIGMLVLASSTMPRRGGRSRDLSPSSAIALLFFPARSKAVASKPVIAGASHWRLHALVLLTHSSCFPLFGLAFEPLLLPLVTPALYAGILFLCTCVHGQSSIAFTAIAKGNVPAAVVQRLASRIIGIFVTPIGGKASCSRAISDPARLAHHR